MSTVISVEHLSKSYRLGALGAGTFREDFSRWWARVRRKSDPNAKIGEELASHQVGHEFWALRDVSFQVREGEILGIVGRNGAGKSTLLKILSRVTGPTSGVVKIKGRIASLLEVGTGFHPELSGRENVFLNGTILGMTKTEIRKKFDEIVEFSEIEEFIDTPVKRYSSGMYVRLAFAVAAHLEPEILIVDEVLAVGDMAFQKKCLGKMQDVSRGGRTVLFVSHNMLAVRQLCTQAILLSAGKIEASGEPSQIAEEYLAGAEAAVIGRKDYDLSKPHVKEVRLICDGGESVTTVQAGIKADLSLRIETLGRKRLVFGMTLFNSDDVGIFSAISSDTSEFIPSAARDLTIEIPTGIFNPGRYRLEGVLLDDGAIVDASECYFQFYIHRSGVFDLAQGKSKGLLRLPGSWVFNEE